MTRKQRGVYDRLRTIRYHRDYKSPGFPIITPASEAYRIAVQGSFPIWSTRGTSQPTIGSYQDTMNGEGEEL